MRGAPGGWGVESRKQTTQRLLHEEIVQKRARTSFRSSHRLKKPQQRFFFWNRFGAIVMWCKLLGLPNPTLLPPQSGLEKEVLIMKKKTPIISSIA